ncbi:MAG: hypothetical protein JXO44_15015, partial [Clostridia bacterium]|nr:hypothetical protein [Clostridia bacterium]
MKNNSNFLFGLILIVVGGFWIAGSCGYIQLSYIHLLFRFWPALLIILGLNMIFQGNKAVMALSVLLLVGCIAYCTQHSELYLRDYNYMFNTNCVESGQGNCVVEDLYDLNGIEKATLKLELGAGDIDITASDSDQLRFGVPNRNMSRTVNTKNEEAD